ncbi:hypothetical protein Thimo_3371 [Thioflavicoccus mobilis 8321]|uniref:Uncharacterized protein n=1 Tax=Thioflavicoccus mobilis 8321 TaxID=765912 RepID=L0H1F8_9GAMM|nr:hypothetical protein [Thioflavicoccus mobilis]AGA92041.1 hypothetical protein Thimo_3371 [Thioflavicoccus mobilis 8321]
MQDRPVITTAIPRRRYQIGEFAATLLADIESGDTRRFRYIVAFVPLGQGEPTLYVCAEEGTADEAGGCCQLVLVNEVMTERLDADARWGDQEAFAEQAIRLGVQVLGLQQEQVVRLL